MKNSVYKNWNFLKCWRDFIYTLSPIAARRFEFLFRVVWEGEDLLSPLTSELILISGCSSIRISSLENLISPFINWSFVGSTTLTLQMLESKYSLRQSSIFPFFVSKVLGFDTRQKYSPRINNSKNQLFASKVYKLKNFVSMPS